MVTDARVGDIVNGDKVPEGNGWLPGSVGRDASYGERVRARWKYGALMGAAAGLVAVARQRFGVADVVVSVVGNALILGTIIAFVLAVFPDRGRGQ